MVNKASKPTDTLIGHDAWNIQLDQNGNLKHFLTVEGLSTAMLTSILDTAESFANINEQRVKKVPLLRGKTIVNLFSKPVPEPAPRLNLPQKGCLLMCSTST